MSQLAAALRVSKSNLYERPLLPAKPRSSYRRAGDAELLRRVRKLLKKRPTYGYRRTAAILTRERKTSPVNHKRAYRVMRENNLLLTRPNQRPTRTHEGKIVTSASNLRWCSDGFELRAWNGEKVYVAFSLDCCDREVIEVVAAVTPLDGSDIRDLMALSVERRFGTTKTQTTIQWLSDNGPPFTADETRDFGRACGFEICNTPAYSPESNGMAEAFVKTLKRDYAYVADLPDAEAILRLLPTWIADYNENHPHKGLKMLSPNQFRRAHAN